MFYSTGGDSRSVDKLSIRGQRAEGTREHGHNGDNEIGRPMTVDRVGDRTDRGEDTEASRALQHLGVGPQACHPRFLKGNRERLVSCGTTPWW